ncbi:MAG: hypothetical protein V7734_16900 [Maribacter arcticus]|uniref:hypothetical protein n=1 Tax=Maribacter arcticus TaxID=561365 RepID=UPI0030037063
MGIFRNGIIKGSLLLLRNSPLRDRNIHPELVPLPPTSSPDFPFTTGVLMPH